MSEPACGPQSGSTASQGGLSGPQGLPELQGPTGSHEGPTESHEGPTGPQVPSGRHWLREPDAGREWRLAAVLGNTNCRVALMEGAEIHDVLVLPVAGLGAEDLPGRLRAFAGEGRVLEAGLCSVVPEREDAVRELFAAAGLPEPRPVRPAVTSFFPSTYRSMETLGADRYCGVLAAHVRYGAPAIVVDCGTATTVNVLDASGVFLGGMIAPGVETALRALHERTAQLPDTRLSRVGEAAETADRTASGPPGTAARPPGTASGLSGTASGLSGTASGLSGTASGLSGTAAGLPSVPPLVGRDTEECMRSGALHFTRFAVAGVAEALQKNVGVDSPLILTGGNAPLLAAAGMDVVVPREGARRAPVCVDSNLLFHGVLFHLLLTT